MTSWILAIDAAYPEHWQIAARERVWDLTRNADIRSGDDVYFWLVKTGLVGHTEATSDIRPLGARDRLPWRDQGVRTYRHRFTLRAMAEQSHPTAKWKELQQRVGTRSYPNLGPVRIDNRRGEEWLRNQFKRRRWGW